jgi:hypothetical protein
MQAVARTLLIVLTLILTGCASGPKYAKDRPPGQACISDDASFANNVMSPTQSVLNIQEVNGSPIKKEDIPVCLVPGKHKFKLYAWTDLRKMNGDVELELKPDVSYWLRAKLSGSWGFGDTFLFQLLDVSNEKQEVVAEFSVPASARSFEFIYVPGGTPLVIPR